MTEEDCKRVAKWLGKCNECKELFCSLVGECIYTFTDPADFFACFDRLVEKGEWDEFRKLALHKYFHHPDGNGVVDILEWLLSKTPTGHYRLCALLSEFIKQKGE